MILSIGHKFVHYESENYNPVYDYDKVLDAYEWLSMKMIKICCKYNSLNNVKLDTFVKASLYSRYTKIEWCKYDLKKKYKVEEYVPRCIQVLDNKHQQIFKLLFRRKSIEQISMKLNENIDVIESWISEIKRILNNNGKSYILNNYLKNTVSFEDLARDIPQKFNVEHKNEAMNIKNMIEESLNHLEQSYRRILIMYWGAGLNAQQILTLINQSNFSTQLENIKIKNDEDLYKYIAYICKEIYNYIKDNYPNYYADYNITIGKTKKMLREYFFYLYDDDKIDETLFYQQIKEKVLK